MSENTYGMSASMCWAPQLLSVTLQGRPHSDPVCWEVINILRGNYKFEVRGHHSMLSTLELPKHLPQEVLDALIQRFK
jgi:hypothetical protein